jgi:signal transduction histidine kinase
MSTRMLTEQQRLAEPSRAPQTDSGATRMIAPSPELLASLADSSASDDEIWPHLNETLYPILHVIRQQVEKMQDVETGLLNQDQIEALAVIDDNAGSAAAALNSLALYRALRAGVSLNPTQLDCAELLNAAHLQVASQAERKGHGLIVHPVDSLPDVLGDPEQSLGILCDMLENAIAYTPFGGEIQLSAENLGDHVLFNVVDNGIGLSAEDMEQIGQPFWRGLRSLLVRSHPGIGLRLYLAREILTRQGGDLIFSGEPDVGSTFSFILPVAR